MKKTQVPVQAHGSEKDRQMDERLRENYYSETGRKSRKRNVRIGFCITLVILLVMSLCNWGIITGWGDVRVDRLKIIGNDGAEFSALCYVPSNASDRTPAPAIIMFHGNAGNARNHESWAVEFSRRGFVVLSVDQFGAGDSQGYFDAGPNGALSLEARIYEADQWYQYLLNMPIVDKENIISSGHSMGSAAATGLGAIHQAKAILAASPAGLLREDRGDSGVYVDAWNQYTGNYVDLTGLVEPTAAQAPQNGLALLQKRDPSATEFEVNTLYGSFEENNAYICVLEPNRIHEAAFVSSQTVGNLLKYGQMAIGEAVPNPIDYNDQVWQYKDYTGLFGIFAFGAFICALALLLIEEIPFFAAIKRPIARNIGLRKVGYLISAILGIVFPYIVLKTDAFGIIGGGQYTNLRNLRFDLGFSNMAFGTLIGLNLLGILGFLLYFFADGRKHQLRLSDLGMTPEGYDELTSTGSKVMEIVKLVLKTALLSAVVIAIAWGYVQLQDEILGTDFYAWFFGIKNIPISKVSHYWNYIVVWIVCFLIASLTLNVERRLPTTGNETLDTVLQIALNVLLATFTIIVVVAVKWHLQTIGSPADQGMIWKMGVDTQRLWGMPVGMTVGVAGSTFLYRKTGNAWLSAILMGTVAALMAVTFGGTRFHFLTYFVA